MSRPRDPTPVKTTELHGMRSAMQQIFEAPILAQEVAQLRAEIQALRAALVPEPSPILTGPEVTKEWQALVRRASR